MTKLCGHGPNECDPKNPDCLADLISELRAREPRWTRVDEGLPEQGVEVLVVEATTRTLPPAEPCTDRVVTVAVNDSGRWVEPNEGLPVEWGTTSSSGACEHVCRVTHWMPLPRLPEEEAPPSRGAGERRG